MLVASGGGQRVDIAWVTDRAEPSARSSAPWSDRSAATEVFAAYLDQTRFSVEQVRFVELIVDELTADGATEPARLYESPYTDRGHIDVIFPSDVDAIVEILRDVNRHALPSGAA